MQPGSHTRVAGVPAAVRVGDQPPRLAGRRRDGVVARRGGWEVGRPRRCAHTCGVDRRRAGIQAAATSSPVSRPAYTTRDPCPRAQRVYSRSIDVHVRISVCALYVACGLWSVARTVRDGDRQPNRSPAGSAPLEDHLFTSPRIERAACLHDVVLPLERDGPTRARTSGRGTRRIGRSDPAIIAGADDAKRITLFARPVTVVRRGQEA
jgi:hypothetical protein